MTITKNTLAALAAAFLAGAAFVAPVPVHAVTAATMDKLIGAPAETFADAAQAVDALKLRLAARDVPGLAKLLGLNPDEFAKTDDLDARLDRLRTAAAESVYVEREGDGKRIIHFGKLVYPFPYPLVEKGGLWSFDTKAGITEAIDRRIGENELAAIQVCRDFIAAQKVYASKDRDGDDVLEYAQRLVSTPDNQDGLYWPDTPGEDQSPAGPFVDASKLDASQRGEGYFGYNFRILRAQGDNVAGGAYDYVINGNMIAGYALIAWPVRWGDTGIMTFACSHHGVVYERNLGPGTAEIVKGIRRFNPLASWAVTRD
jgi:hypothetical protein